MSRATTIHAGIEPYPGLRLDRFLGRGGFSEVWQAQTEDGRSLALKFMTCENKGAVPKEIRALQMVRQLNHPHFVHIERIWIYESYIVIAMELADGSLHDLLEAYETEFNTPIDGPRACFYLLQAADAIDFLNSPKHLIDGRKIGIQHCDVKPSNLLLFQDTVKLSDFGLCGVMTGQLDWRARAGTVAYCAPEVFHGKLSNRTDQYGLAVSYYVLRTGKVPFHDMPEQFVHGYIPPPPDVTLLPVEEQAILTRGLHPVPSNRFSSCTEMINRLVEVVGQ
jgi:serine/threonine-protein kinase